MTSSRAIRGTRAKVFFYICALLIITGLIACYNNTLSQLDNVRNTFQICRQQEENLSTQLQVIYDYKQRLEKSLKTEKAEHQQTKLNLENKLNEEKNKNDKTFGDAKLKFDSLQQHFNLLQTEYDDFKDECSKNQQKQQEEVNDLQARLEELREELKKVKTSRDNLKNEYMALLSENGKLEKQWKDYHTAGNDNESQINHLTKVNHELKRELEKYTHNFEAQDTVQRPKSLVEPSSPNPAIKISSGSTASARIADVKPMPANPEQHVLAKPSDNNNKMASPKSTTQSGVKSSTGRLNGARPIGVPTVTPETIQKKNNESKPSEKTKIPDGVVVPQKKEEQNDQSEPVNNRYRNIKESVNEEKKANQDLDNENGAHEQFDAPLHHNAFDGLQFGGNEAAKNGAKQSVEKKHIDNLAVNNNRNNYDQDPADYKDMQNDVQLEENEEDDDAEGYDEHLARQKDMVVRN